MNKCKQLCRFIFFYLGFRATIELKKMLTFFNTKWNLNYKIMVTHSYALNVLYCSKFVSHLCSNNVDEISKLYLTLLRCLLFYQANVVLCIGNSLDFLTVLFCCCLLYLRISSLFESHRTFKIYVI